MDVDISTSINVRNAHSGSYARIVNSDHKNDFYDISKKEREGKNHR